MSITALLSDVIEEVHESERSLGYGDIPDQTVFKHFRSLWHLLLGIDESKYDSHNYELIDVIFTSDNVKFSGFTYLGPDFQTISDNFIHSVGSPTESLNVVEILDTEPTDKSTKETSISFKLSMLNKIRFIVFRHHLMINDLLTDSQFEEELVKHLNNDILNLTNNLDISFKSNNATLNKCYRQCFQDFILTDSTLTIHEIAKEILESFKAESDIAYFFNYKLILNFNDQIVEFLKRIFRKHELVVIEIEDFFRHNPVLPILKPIFRKAALQSLDETNNQINTENETIPNLDIQLVIEIISEVTSQSTGDQFPSTFHLFPQIIDLYRDSLSREDVFDIENDPYILLIKSEIVKWVKGEVGTESFTTQLVALSQIPVAMPYKFQDQTFPNAHMRMALYMLKDGKPLLEIYFQKWSNRTKCYDSLAFVEQEFGARNIAKYYGIWKYKYKKIKLLSYANIEDLENIQCSLYLRKWKDKHTEIIEWNTRADLIQKKQWMNKMKAVYNKFKNLNEKALLKDQELLLRKSMKVWVSMKENRFPNIVIKFNLQKRKTYFTVMRNVVKKYHDNNKQAVSAYNQNTIQHYFDVWKLRSREPLEALHMLNQKSSLFIVAQKFTTWKRLYDLNLLEKQLVADLDLNKVKKMFGVWKKFRTLSNYETKLRQEASDKIIESYFHKWKTSHTSLYNADNYYVKTKVKNTFGTWKLKTKGIEYETQILVANAKQYLDIWRLKTTENFFKRSHDMSMVKSAFITWSNRSNKLKTDINNSLSGYNIVRVGTYFKMWNGIVERRKLMEIESDVYRENRLEKNNMLMKRWMFDSLKINCRESRLKRSELNRTIKVFQTKMIRKYLHTWKTRKEQVLHEMNRANYHRNILYGSRILDLWLLKLDNVFQLENILYSKLDTDNLNLVSRIMSKMQLRMVNVYTNNSKADMFKQRWNRIRCRNFFELWKLKKTNRTSPTPTARNNIRQDYNGNIPDLNPYIDLGPKDRGSPAYRGTFRPQFTSIISGNTSKFEISGSVTEAQTPITPRTGFGSATYRTPKLRRIIGRSTNPSTIGRVSPDRNENNISESARRARQQNTEEMMSYFRLIRSPPDGKIQNSSMLGESEQETFEVGSIFDTPNDSMVSSSTPVKSNRR